MSGGHYPHYYLAPEDREKLRELAERDGRSDSGFLRWLIRMFHTKMKNGFAISSDLAPDDLMAEWVLTAEAAEPRTLMARWLTFRKMHNIEVRPAWAGSRDNGQKQDRTP
jgi:hypothetical protein